MKKGYTIPELLVVIFLAVMFIHVCCVFTNIYLLTKCDFKEPYKAEALRIGANFIPTGTIIMSLVSNESLGEPVSK